VVRVCVHYVDANAEAKQLHVAYKHMMRVCVCVCVCVMSLKLSAYQESCVWHLSAQDVTKSFVI
jgi:hypothetical protein